MRGAIAYIGSTIRVNGGELPGQYLHDTNYMPFFVWCLVYMFPAEKAVEDTERLL